MLLRKLQFRAYFLCISFKLHKCLTAAALPQEWEDTSIEAALRYAVSEINNGGKLNLHNKLESEVHHSISSNIFHIAKRGKYGGCEVLAEISPKGGIALRRTRYISDSRTILIMQPNLDDYCEVKHQSFVKMSPEPSSLSRAYLDIIQYFHWNKLCFIYGEEKDILQLQTILTGKFNPNVEFIVRQARPTQMLEVLKEIKHRGITKLLVHLTARDTLKLLRTALLVGMIDYSRHVLLTNLDIETIPLDEIQV